jgi:hypothetical protein
MTAILETVLAHASATRIMLRKGRGEERVAKIHDSVRVVQLLTTMTVYSVAVDEADRSFPRSPCAFHLLLFTVQPNVPEG